MFTAYPSGLAPPPNLLASSLGGPGFAPSPSKLRRTGLGGGAGGASGIGIGMGIGGHSQSPLRVKPMEFAPAPETPVASAMPTRPAVRLRFPDEAKRPQELRLKHCEDWSLGDAAFWRSRSRRVAWGPGGSLVRIEGQRIHLVSVFAPETSREASIAEENLLNAALDTSTSDSSRSSRSVSCPRWTPQPGVEPLNQYLAELESQPDSVLARLLSLTRALWAPMAESENSPSPEQLPQLCRKQSFTDWVQSRPVADDAELIIGGDGGDECASVVFRLLSSGQFAEACAAALKRRQYRLALLLGQPHTDSVRALIGQQVACWYQSGARDFIPAGVWRLYRLLAGTVTGTAGMDWIRAFTLYLWFATPYTDGIPSALRAYKAAFKGRATSDGLSSASLSQPPPPYNGEHGGSMWDTAYHLVQLHCKRGHRLSRLLDPRGYGPDPIDYGPAWHLWRCLRALGFTHLTDAATKNLHCGYAAQLESQGLWDWALFVLLHLDDDLARIRAVSDCLSRHLGTVQDPALQKFLTEQLGLPREWLHAAWALACRSQLLQPSGDSRDAWLAREARHWVQAGQWRPAHAILLGDLVPRWIAAGCLRRVRSSLEPVGRLAGDRQDWQLGGQLFLDFLRLLDDLEAVQRGDKCLAPEEAQASLASLCTRVAALPSSTPHQRVCQSELAQRCAHLLRQLLPDSPDRQTALLAQLSGLCCPMRCADCLLHKLLLK